MTTLLFDGKEANASVESSGAIWVATSELERATGFHLEPKGFCRGEMCVPLPHGETVRFTSGSRRSPSDCGAPWCATTRTT